MQSLLNIFNVISTERFKNFAKMQRNVQKGYFSSFDKFEVNFEETATFSSKKRTAWQFLPFVLILDFLNHGNSSKLFVQYCIKNHKNFEIVWDIPRHFSTKFSLKSVLQTYVNTSEVFEAHNSPKFSIFK